MNLQNQPLLVRLASHGKQVFQRNDNPSPLHSRTGYQEVAELQWRLVVAGTAVRFAGTICGL